MKVVIVGPTGVGKTKMSIALAKQLDAYIINADATQIYQELNIGSSKVTKEEMQGVKHLLLDIKRPDEEYSVMEYQKDIRAIFNKDNKTYIICGGTGLYITAGLYDYRFYEDNDIYLDNLSNEELYELVLRKDKDSKIDKNNRIRMERFLKRSNKEIVEPKLLYDDCLFIGLTTNRDNLYRIINNRVEEMFQAGLVEEVKTLLEKYPDSKILKRAIGYKEVIEYINGNISLEECIELVKKNSRHYAKRQYTWFNNKMDIKWFNVNYDNFDETIREVMVYISCHK